MAEEKTDLEVLLNVLRMHTPFMLTTGKWGKVELDRGPEGPDEPGAKIQGCTLLFEKPLTLADLVALQKFEAVRALSNRSTLTSSSIRAPNFNENARKGKIDLLNNIFVNKTEVALRKEYFPTPADREEAEVAKERAGRAQPPCGLPSGGQVTVYKPITKQGVKILEAEFSTEKPTYIEAAEAISMLLANEQQANSSSSNSSSSSQAGSETLTLRISFKNPLGGLDKKEYQVEVGPDKPPFDYSRLSAEFGGSSPAAWVTNIFDSDKTLSVLIRRYEPSLLLLKLEAEKIVKQQKEPGSIGFSQTVTEVLIKGPGQTGVLRADDVSVNPVTVLDFVLNKLKPDKLENSPSMQMRVFFQHTAGADFFEKFARVALKGQVSDSTMSSVKTFDETLQALWGASRGLGGSKPPAKNNRIPEIMAGEDYKALIDRVGIINRRKKEGSPTYESDLLKMQGILAIEDAFEKARLEPDKGKALQMIKTAIQANQEDVSAYSGDLSKGFFSFFHRDTKDVGSFFTHGYNSTSDKLLNGLLAEIKSETPAAAPTPGNLSDNTLG